MTLFLDEDWASDPDEVVLDVDDPDIKDGPADDDDCKPLSTFRREEFGISAIYIEIRASWLAGRLL